MGFEEDLNAFRIVIDRLGNIRHTPDWTDDPGFWDAFREIWQQYYDAAERVLHSAGYHAACTAAISLVEEFLATFDRAELAVPEDLGDLWRWLKRVKLKLEYPSIQYGGSTISIYSREAPGLDEAGAAMQELIFAVAGKDPHAGWETYLAKCVSGIVGGWEARVFARKYPDLVDRAYTKWVAGKGAVWPDPDCLHLRVTDSDIVSNRFEKLRQFARMLEEARGGQQAQQVSTE